MVPTSVRGWRAGRALALVVGGLGIFSVLAMTQAGAQPAKQPSRKGPATGPVKGPKGIVVKGPTSIKITITSPGTDVPEMVKVINEKIADGWKANKITP